MKKTKTGTKIMGLKFKSGYDRGNFPKILTKSTVDEIEYDDCFDRLYEGVCS